jgi:uncharacterized protein (TIGR01777 family)
MKVLVIGATGLIGRALCQSLTAGGHTAIAVSRSPRKPPGLAVAEVHQWHYQQGMLPAVALAGVEAIVNVAGESIVARRWSDEQKKLIRDSRVVTTRKIVESLGALDTRPGVFVSGSAVGFYGDRGDEHVDETSPPGRGFMSEICQEWEREAARAKEIGVRVVQVRTGVVLSTEGGALQKMLRPFKLGIGGPLGSGRQWFPWIHIDDIVGIFKHAILTASLAGPANGTAPQPVTNAEFTRELGKVLHRPAFLPVPQVGLRILMGEMSEVLFVSQRVLPKVTLASGYKFQFPSLAPALDDLLGGSKTAKGAA